MVCEERLLGGGHSARASNNHLRVVDGAAWQPNRGWWTGIGLNCRLKLSTKHILSMNKANDELETSKSQADYQLESCFQAFEATVP